MLQYIQLRMTEAWLVLVQSVPHLAHERAGWHTRALAERGLHGFLRHNRPIKVNEIIGEGLSRLSRTGQLTVVRRAVRVSESLALPRITTIRLVSGFMRRVDVEPLGTTVVVSPVRRDPITERIDGMLKRLETRLGFIKLRTCGRNDLCTRIHYVFDPTFNYFKLTVNRFVISEDDAIHPDLVSCNVVSDNFKVVIVLSGFLSEAPVVSLERLDASLAIL